MVFKAFDSEDQGGFFKGWILKRILMVKFKKKLTVKVKGFSDGES